MACYYPLGELSHLKRIKRLSESCLQVLLDTTSQSTLNIMNQFLKASGIPYSKLEIVSVPKHAPWTKKQFDEWKQVWPMSFHHNQSEKYQINLIHLNIFLEMII